MAEDLNDNGGMAQSRNPWSMRVLAIALGFLPLIAMELAARALLPARSTWQDPIVDVSSQADLFLQQDGSSEFVTDPSRLNYFRPASFAAVKPDTTRRIFVLGGSTVQGRPFATETAFAKWLQILLSNTDSTHDYEVVNCGGVSYASYRVSRILDEVLNHQPDAIVIYTGHNEFLEERTYADQRSGNPFDDAVNHLAGKLQSVRAIQQWRSHVRTAEVLSSEVSARLDVAGGLDEYFRDDVWRTGVEQDFTVSLRSMIQRCHDAAIPLVLCVPAGDLVRTPPFKVTTYPRLSPKQQANCLNLWQQLTSDAAVSQKNAACERLLDIDPRHAGANYWLGRNAFEAGDLAKARKHLTIARDEDVCPLRATTHITESVLLLAEEFRVPMVDVPALLDQDDDGIADPKNFVDHVHPSIAAHQRIAIAVGRKLDWDPIDDNKLRAFQMAASQHLSSLGEEYFVRGRQRLKGLQQWAAGRAGLSSSNERAND